MATNPLKSLEKTSPNSHNSCQKTTGGGGEPRTPAMRQMMQNSLVRATLVAVFLPLMSGGVTAGPIENACMRSDRAGANRALCGCIQQAADMTLQSGDQRRAAAFFKDPEEAHSIWISQSASDDAFWERYKAFGSTAETYCAG
jgi:hypothetical protein